MIAVLVGAGGPVCAGQLGSAGRGTSVMLPAASLTEYAQRNSRGHTVGEATAGVFTGGIVLL